jgi:outer membrane biosynthesis protein TonB
VALIALGLAGCARREPPAHAAVPLAVRIAADTARGERLSVARPPARVWLERVGRDRQAPRASDANAAAPTPARGPVPEPIAASDTLSADFTPPALEISDDLKPPLLRDAPALQAPRGARRQFVEIDVRVDEAGDVSDALWAEGSQDSSVVEAALVCARGMRFYPALRAGRPIAVWCRQRFDFGMR